MSDAIENLAQTLKPRLDGVLPGGDFPFRIGQISATTGLGNTPPTVTVREGEFAVDMPVAGYPWEYQVYDVVYWMMLNGSPLVMGTLPGVGGPSLLAEDIDDDPEPWHVVSGAGEPAFNTGWTNFGGGVHAVAAFRKQTDGWVGLKGLVKRTSGSEQGIFNIPVGFRPEVGYNFYFTGKSHTTMAELRVDTDGWVRYISAGDPTQWVSLIDVFYPTRVNPAAWIHPIIEGYDTNVGVIGEAVRTYLRGDGWCWWTGILRDTSPPGAATVIMRIDTRLAGNPFGKMLNMLGAGSTLARLDFGGSAIAGLRSPCRVVYQDTAPATFVILGGSNYWSESGANAPWINASYENFWATYTGGDLDLSIPASYLLDSHGMVHLRGLTTGASRTADTIFTLPVGMRPLEQHVFKSHSSGSHGRLDVEAGGAVKAQDAGTGFRALDGIHFYAEQ